MVDVGILVEGNIIFIWTSGLRSVVIGIPKEIVIVNVLSCEWTLTLVSLDSLRIRKARVVMRIRITVCRMIIIRNWGTEVVELRGSTSTHTTVLITRFGHKT